MKIFLQNTFNGLIPIRDDDFEKKSNLKIGEIYCADIKLLRNYEFHKKYFALINCAWEYQNEKTQSHFKNNIEAFRKTIEIASGNYEPVYSIKRKEWLEVPKSISFESMKENEFSELYENVRNIIFSIFLKAISEEEFEKNLINF